MAIAASERTEDMVEVTSFAEVTEALRLSSKLAAVLDEASLPIRAGTVLRIDGEAHTKRRRLLNRLVFRNEHARYRERALHPAFERNLAAVLARANGGVEVAQPGARADLVDLVTRSLVELMGAMVGLDEAVTREGMDALVRLHAQLEEFPRLKTQLRGAAPPVPEGEAGLRRAVETLERSKREFAQRFYEPALAAHRALLARFEAGELTEAELPNDFLMLVAAHGDPTFAADADLPRRHAIIDLLHAGVGTSVGAVVHAVDELFRWLRDHPEDAALTADDAFVWGAVAETLRLHAANPAEVRRALEDVTLSGGTVIRAGQYVALRTGIADRDTSVFGTDANRFEPRRTPPPGVGPYGLAFGAGPHMCFGLPLAIGNEGPDGNLAYFVRRLFAASVRRDPERAGRYHPGIANADLRGWESYPVLLTAS